MTANANDDLARHYTKATIKMQVVKISAGEIVAWPVLKRRAASPAKSSPPLQVQVDCSAIVGRASRASRKLKQSAVALDIGKNDALKFIWRQSCRVCQVCRAWPAGSGVASAPPAARTYLYSCVVLALGRPTGASLMQV